MSATPLTVGTSRLKLWLAAIVYLAFVGTARPQEGRYLALKGPGTASVFWAENSDTAYITDGGKDLGNAHVGDENKGVLQSLLDKGVKNLVITCSHPHSDHMDGLVRSIQNDPNIFKFDRLYFVQSDYPGGVVGKASLHEIYNAALKEQNPGKRPKVAKPISATNQDAYSEIAKELKIPKNAPLRVSNFKYDPKEVSPEKEKYEHPHGRCIITQYTLRKSRGDGTEDVCRVVDLDDANTELVAFFARKQKQAPDVLILPHHGSPHTDIRPLLAKPMRPRSIIVTVNPENQYLHPGAENLLRCILAVGRENVHFTGSLQNVAVTAEGVKAVTDAAAHAANYQSFLEPQWREVSNHLIRLEEQIFAKPDDKDLQVEYEKQKRREQSLLALKSILTKTSPTRLGSARRSGEDDFGLPPILSRPPVSPKGSPGMSSSPPNRDWVSRPAGFGRTGVGGSAPKSPSTGDYASLKRTERVLIGPRIARPSSRGERIRANQGARAPLWGGIILGNTVKRSPKPARAEFRVGSKDRVSIQVELVGKKGLFSFDEVTPTELWCAYRFLHPDEGMKKLGAEVGDVGLVGKTDDFIFGSGWYFGIHPAIADTLLARDAMRLDMVIALGDPSLPKFPEWIVNYQWYDESGEIVVRDKDKSIVVRAAEGPKQFLMRVHVWDEKGPSAKFDATASLSTLYDKFEAMRRIDRFAKVVAVLNWLDEAGKLPPLPPKLRPAKSNIPAWWYFKDVLSEKK